jgi:SAM-dependent methyltransferase
MNSGRHTLEVMQKADWYNRWLISFFSTYLNGDILDAGAGIGNFSDLLGKYGKVTAIETNREYLKSLTQSLNAGFGDIEKGKYYFKKRKFDTLVSFNVFEHIKDDLKAINNARELLKYNGYFIFLVPAHKFLYSDFDKEIGHFRRYTVKEVEEKLKKAGFKIEFIRYFNWWAAIGWFVFMKILKSKKMPRSPVAIFDTLGKVFLLPEKFIKFPFGLSVLAVAKRED